jgi:hypothetical protein
MSMRLPAGHSAPPTQASDLQRGSGAGRRDMPPGIGSERFHEEVQQTLRSSGRRQKPGASPASGRSEVRENRSGPAGPDEPRTPDADGARQTHSAGVPNRSSEADDAGPGHQEGSGAHRHTGGQAVSEGAESGAVLSVSPVSSPIAALPPPQAAVGSQLMSLDLSGVSPDPVDGEPPRFFAPELLPASAGAEAAVQNFEMATGPLAPSLFSLDTGTPISPGGTAGVDAASSHAGLSLDAHTIIEGTPREQSTPEEVRVEAVWSYDHEKAPPQHNEMTVQPGEPGIDGLTLDQPRPAESGSTQAAAQLESSPTSLGTRAAEAVPLAHLPGRIARLAGELGEARTTGLRLRLDPPSLGEIRVQIETTGHGIDIRIVTQSGEAAALLSDRQQQLREELARNGLVLQQFSTAVGSHSGHSPGAGSGGSQFGWQQAGRSTVTGVSFDPAWTGTPAAGPADSRLLRAGRLDARA